MSSPLVSIIVPIYNQEAYLRDCLNSIASQSFSDFEVICIDDGSTDSSAEIYNDFTGKDSRFTVFRKPNGGVSSARNFGLQKASGKYVLFADADDVLPANTIDNHLKHFSGEIDLTEGAFRAFSDKNSETYKVEIDKDEIVSTERCLYDFTPNGKTDWQRYLWNRMMRLSIIKDNDIRFNERIAYKEDGLFLVQYLLKCKGQVAYFPEIVYNYRLNPTSAMGGLAQGRTKKLVTNIDAHALIIKTMKDAKVSDYILDKEINHAFQSRRWVLDKITDTKSYFMVWFRTISVLLCAIGFSSSMRIAIESARRRLNR